MMRYFLEGTADIGLVCLISLNKTDKTRFDDPWLLAGFILAVCSLLMLALSPVYLAYAWLQLQKAIKNNNGPLGNRYIVLFNIYRSVKSFSCCCYGIIFFVRRFILLIVLV